MLTPSQIHTLTEIIEKQTLLFIGKTMGDVALTEQDKKTLEEYGINWKALYDERWDLISTNFQLGMLSNILSSEQVKNLTYDQLLKYISSGQHIPLNSREKATINSIKMQSLSDIRGIRGKIFNDINGVVINSHGSARANQEEYLRENIIQGTIDRKSRKTIAREIAKATGDWSRNFNKSVAYISHTALNEGRAAILERRYEGSGKEPKLYFQVQEDACDHCVRIFLTAGPGSEPRIFTLRELQSNGSNIGRKVAEWKPCLHALHVHCRCLATEYIEGTVWDGKRFVQPKTHPNSQPKVNRPKIRIVVDGKEHWV